MRVHICSFSSNAAELKPRDRTLINVLLALKENSRISTFDMSLKPWLCDLIQKLEKKNYIKPRDEQYPWHKWDLTKAGLDAIEKLHKND